MPELWSRSLAFGESHGVDNVRRVKGAYQQECDTIPVLFLLPKDHKEKEANGDPKTKPVCGARRSANGRVGNLISEVLRAVVDSEETDEMRLKRCSTTWSNANRK